MEIESLFGLPAHPLFVHGAVVLVPLAVLAFLLTSWRGKWRRQYGLPVLWLAAVGALFMFLAAQSGPPLRQELRDAALASGQPRPDFGDHSDLGTSGAFLAAFFAVALAGFVALERWLPNGRRSRWPLVAAAVVSTALGLLALIWTVRAGHSGAALVWGE